MVHVTASDNVEHIRLSDGFLPTTDEMLAALPWRQRHRLTPIHERPIDEEDGRAWALTLHALQIAERKGYDPKTRPPLETWILGPSNATQSRFAAWLNDAPANYRLIVHRYPVAPSEQAESPLTADRVCTSTYQRLRIKRTPMRSSESMAPLVDFAHEVHAAYRQGPTAVLRCFDASDHRYAHATSRGSNP